MLADHTMPDSPIPIARHSQTELIDRSPELQSTTAIDEDSISDKPDLQILVQSTDNRTSSSGSHIDENNENDAVRLTRTIESMENGGLF